MVVCKIIEAMNRCRNSFQEPMFMLNGMPMLHSTVSRSDAVRMNMSSIRMLAHRLLVSCAIHLTYSMLIHRMMISEKELDKSLEVAFIMSPGAKMSLDNRKMIPIRSANTATMARTIHLIYWIETPFLLCAPG